MLLLIALLPFLGFLANAAFGRRLSRAVSGGVACATLIGSSSAGAAADTITVRLPGSLTLSYPVDEIRRADGSQQR